MNSMNSMNSVKQSLWLLLLMSMIAVADQPIEQNQQIYLEGISVLGEHKRAHITINAAKMSVQEGDELGEWTVYEIHQRSIVLQNELGEEKILELHSRIDVTLPSVTEQQATPADELLQRFPDANPFAGRPRIDDADVPAGKRKVVTPFGDFLVDIVDNNAERDRLVQQAEQNVLSAFANANGADGTDGTNNEQDDSKTNTEQEIEQSEIQVIRTPFGDLPVNMGQ